LGIVESVREVLEEIKPAAETRGVFISGPCVYTKPYDAVDVVVICNGYSQGLRTRLLTTKEAEFRFLFVDDGLIESDIVNGALGDFLTDKLLYPFSPVLNEDYVCVLGQKVRTRIVEEEVRELVIDYGEMCRGIVAKPEFFALSRMRKRARIFVPSMSDYTRFLGPTVKDQNITQLRVDYRNVLAVRKDLVTIEEDDVAILDTAVDKWLGARGSRQVVNILEQGRRAFYSYVARGRSLFLNLDLLSREIYDPFRLGHNREASVPQPEDPKNYLYLRTATGLTPINAKTSVQEVISTIRPGRPITISPLAGVLNEVFLVTSGSDRFVAKRFTDWYGFKWFTLNLVSFGSKTFSVSGRARMGNEYGINRYLAKKRLNVPEIVHASVNDRILLESYVSGFSLEKVFMKAVNASELSTTESKLFRTLGETLGQIHNVGVSIGDSKPENFMAKENSVYAVDLEQAGKKGDYAWDVAELLFYAGHYSANPTPIRGLTEATQSIIEGYLTEGDPSNLKRAAGVKYAKVFSVWTPAPVLFEISKILRSVA
jgi:tRNA A-37 threonylcarbamoyl transferase component Bud32